MERWSVKIHRLIGWFSVSTNENYGKFSIEVQKSEGGSGLIIYT